MTPGTRVEEAWWLNDMCLGEEQPTSGLSGGSSVNIFLAQNLQKSRVSTLHMFADVPDRVQLSIGKGDLFEVHIHLQGMAIDVIFYLAKLT